MTDFTTFGLADFLLDSLSRLKITAPTPVQAESIPLGMAGKDVLASAQTGTGKTLAYLLPIITHLENKPQGNALILTPTRELAQQVKDSISQLLGRVNMNFALLIGGEPMFRQYTALKRHPRIVIGTPGRINDHLNRRTLKLHDTHYLVLDETDRMLDLGFSQDLERIAECLPKERQTFMFSATMPPSIVKLSHQYLNDPQRVTIGSSTQPCAKIKQETVQTTGANKFPQLLKELEEREGSVIIFVKTKIGADRLADKLKDEDHFAEAIHGDLKQRQRDQVIRAFRSEKFRILVATDVAARGLDIPHIMHVVNFDLPQCPEDYIHRIGRTGRAGMEGNAVSFISPDEKWKWRSISRLINDGQSDDSYSPGNNNRRRSGGGGRSFDRRDDRRGGGDRSSHFRRDDNRGSDDRRPSFRRDDNRGEARSDDRRPSFRRDDAPRGEARSDDRRPSFRRDDSRSDDRRPSFRRDDAPREARSDDRRPSFRRDDAPREARSGDDRRPSFRRDDAPREARSDDRRPSFRRDDAPREARSGDDRRPSFRRDDAPREARSDDRRPSFRRDDAPRGERTGGDERRSAPRRDDARGDGRKRTYKPKVVEGAAAKPKRRYDAPKKDEASTPRKRKEKVVSEIV